MRYSRFTHVTVALSLLLALTWTIFGQDGPPGEFGPTDPHRLSPVGLNQKVLVIYVQASDFQIVPAELAALNTTMDTRRNKVSPWFQETTYNQLTVDMTPRRTGTGGWYTLPGTLLEYVRPSTARSMQARNAASATTVNPTPAASMTGTAAATAGSQFATADAGNYRYAVSTFRNGQESQLTKVAGAITVAAGDAVTLTITRAAASDADRFLIYRTNVGAADNDNNYFRIGQLDVSGTTASFVDNGIKMDRLGDWHHIITDAMEAADPDVPDFDIFKGVLVVIFSPFLRGQAGAFTFTIGGSPINMSGVYLASNEDFGRYTHEMGHWIGLPDLYDPVTAGSIATWDTMDCSCDGQYQTWEKDFLLHYLVNPANVLRLVRPAPGNPDLDQNFIIHPTEIADTFADRQTALKIKASDTVHYYIEGRRRLIAGNTSDQAIPAQHIVITETIDVLPMGIIPRRNVRLLRTLNAGDPFFSPEPGDPVQITFTTINNPGGDESYNVNVKLKAQPQPDPKITPWSPPPWESPDIWVDSSRENGGFQDPATATPLAANGEHAWVNHENRVWAKITNAGDGPANNVTVKFKVNTPGGMGEAGQFVDLPSPAPINLAPHESKMVFALWTPTVGSHTCISVEVDHVVGESDINNNFAQENITNFYTGSSSPWHDVVIPMDVANPFPESKRVDIQVAGLPAGWRAKVENLWVNLDARGRKMVQATITPPPTAPECTVATLNVYAQTRIDDFIQPYSGFTPVIHLANPIAFRNSVEKIEDKRSGTVRYRVSGCTIPAQANTEIAIQLEGPGGQTSVVFVTTDAAGCFNTFVTFPFPGDWKVRTYFRGSKCKAPTESEPTSVQVPQTGFGPLARGLWYSFHLGHNFPLGSFRKTYNSGPSVTADLEYVFNDRYSLYGMLGYHYFNGKTPGITDLTYTNVSLNLRGYFPVSTWRGYVQAGPGVYFPNFGPTKAGFNVGTGLDFHIHPKLAIELGTDFHFVDPGGTNRVFADPKLGIKFRF